jgi:tripartite-type tricarboxylate transporter receptor subunit TctC
LAEPADHPAGRRKPRRQHGYGQSHLRRIYVEPGVPSMREAGFSGVYASTWYALFGPPNLPPAIVAKLNAEVNEFLRGEDARKRFAFLGFRAIGGSREQPSKRMADDTLLWSKVIKDANVRLDGKQ